MPNEDNNIQSSSIPSPPNPNKLFEDILSMISTASPNQAPTVENKNTDNTELPVSPEPISPSVNASKSPNPTSDIMSALLSNPELLSKLPSLLSSIKPIMEMFSKPSIPASSNVPASNTPSASHAETASAISNGTISPNPQYKGEADRRSALLCAMKPYLNQDRQNTIDYLIKISRLGDILKTL